MTDYLKEHYTVVRHALNDDQKKEWETCADYYEAYYRYNESLIQDKKVSELSEDWELIEKLEQYLS